MQAAELESFLFARDDAALDQLGAEGEGDFGGVADLVRRAGLQTLEADEGAGLLIYEDRAGAEEEAEGAAAASGGGASTSGAAAAEASGRRPAWEDPDDALLEVNVAAKPRLRKLRQEEEETVITGEGGRQPSDCSGGLGRRCGSGPSAACCTSAV